MSVLTSKIIVHNNKENIDPKSMFFDCGADFKRDLTVRSSSSSSANRNPQPRSLHNAKSTSLDNTQPVKAKENGVSHANSTSTVGNQPLASKARPKRVALSNITPRMFRMLMLMLICWF
jgi:hypothetical protein